MKNWFSNHFSNRCEKVTLRHTWKFTRNFTWKWKKKHRKSWESCCWNAFCRKECQTKRRQWSEPFLPCDFEQKCEVVKSENKKNVIFPHCICCICVAVLLHFISLVTFVTFAKDLLYFPRGTVHWGVAEVALHRTPFLTQLSLLHLGPGKPAAVQGGFSNHLTISTYQGSLAAAEADLRLSFHICHFIPRITKEGPFGIC